MDKAKPGRQRILFVAEAVTLAHVARPLVLAQALDPERFEVHFACAEGNEFVFRGTHFRRWPIHSIPSTRFLHALATGARLYDYATLAGYVEEELRLLERVRPALVVGDFRLSLAVSAPLRQVPYAALTNAHWSPYSISPFPLPEHPLGELLGVPVATALFRLARPLVFAYHAHPLNALRRSHGLAPIGDLRHVYTHGDYTLFLDVPGLVPTSPLPANHRYIGPVLWSPEGELPAWWERLPADRPCIYVTLGSSGNVGLLPMVVDALTSMDVNVLVATAGRTDIAIRAKNVWVADYLPGSRAARRSALVICGGSATAYQALAEGKPVLGIPSNMDQYLTMGCIQRAGAGLLVRAGRATKARLREATERLVTEAAFTTAATSLAAEFSRHPAPERFRAFVDEVSPIRRP